MSILEDLAKLTDLLEEHNRIEAEGREYQRKIDAWWEECRQRAAAAHRPEGHVSLVDAWCERCRQRIIAQNPQTHADLGKPL